jgi:hypothetical protein
MELTVIRNFETLIATKSRRVFLAMSPYVYSDRYVATFWRKALPSSLLSWSDDGDSRLIEIFFIPNYSAPLS